MNYIDQSFSVQFDYKVYFTSALFDPSNATMDDFLKSRRTENTNQKIFFIIDNGVLKFHPDLTHQIKNYFKTYNSVNFIPDILIIPGGESAKNDTTQLDQIIEAINKHGVDRHSYIAAIGGGSVLDLSGYAAAISHRGIRNIRIPTTVLSQNDSGVGVKNGINYKGKKIFLELLFRLWRFLMMMFFYLL
jgi:3-dehydroquinate synthase